MNNTFMLIDDDADKILGRFASLDEARAFLDHINDNWREEYPALEGRELEIVEVLPRGPRCIRCGDTLPPCVACQGHQLCDPEYCTPACRRADEEEANASTTTDGR